MCTHLNPTGTVELSRLDGKTGVSLPIPLVADRSFSMFSYAALLPSAFVCLLSICLYFLNSSDPVSTISQFKDAVILLGSGGGMRVRSF